MAVFELENLIPLPDGEISPRYCYEELDYFVLAGGLRENTTEIIFYI
jgi:hypothetical protein